MALAPKVELPTAEDDPVTLLPVLGAVGALAEGTWSTLLSPGTAGALGRKPL